jgi:hypothetical protein
MQKIEAAPAPTPDQLEEVNILKRSKDDIFV